ncbi:sugar porter family MFS transporter [Mycolicibacterium pulveris]|uniref:sugar porter family MFS transporter n=1 Tax=Mycolicibacterium pulveris TaxID=36813 RepID=UPI003CF831BB
MRKVLIGIASLGGLLFGYETGVAAGALQNAEFSWTGTSDGQLLLSTATLLGALVGALAGGRIADVVGRRDVIMATTALFTLGAFVSAIAPSSLVLVAGRLVVGLAVGAISVAAPLYIAEIAPARRRGSLICVFQLMITIGILAAYIGNELLAHRPDGWRYLLAGGVIPALLLSGLALVLVESPVWLALKGDRQAAVAVLRRIDSTGSTEEIDAISRIPRDGRSDDLAEVFSLASRGAVFVAIGLFFVQQFVGLNAMIYYSTSSLTVLYESLHFGGQDWAGLSLAALGVLATIVAIALIDRIGRRPLLLGSLIGVAVGLATMAVGAGLHAGFTHAYIVSAAGLYLFVASFGVGLGPIPWVAAAEMVPLGARGLAMSVVVAAHWLFDSLASPTGLLLRREFGGPALLVVFAGVAVLGCLIFRRGMPETKGLSLAAIDRYFTNRAARIKDSRLVHYLVTGVATMGGLLTGYTFAITAVTLVLIEADWNLTALEQGVLASVLVAGLAAGSFLAGPLSDRFGRRYVLMSMAALFVASAFGAALAPSFGWLVVARAAAGLAIGITSPTAGLYVAEVAPAAIRGRLLSFEAVAYGFGTILAYCVGLALEDQVAGWRTMFGFLAVPSAIYGVALLTLPESPRWLTAIGQPTAARRSLLRLFGGDADTELAAITAEKSASETNSDATPGARARLWHPTYRPAILVGLVVMFLIVFSGWDMVLFYAPTILKEIGFNDTTVSFAATLGLGVVFLVMTVISLAIIDRVGRKPMVTIGLFVMAASLLLMAGLTTLGASSAAQWGQVASLAVFVGAFALTLGVVGELVISELYPQSIRGPAVSLSHGMRSIFAIVFTLTFPLLLDFPGLTVTLVAYAAISVVGALYLMRALPETKGRSLEEIGAYWKNRRAPARTPVAAPAP